MPPPDDHATPPEAADVVDAVADRLAAAEVDDVVDDVARDEAADRGDDATDADDEVAVWKARLAEARISPRAHEALSEAREHLDTAWQRSDAGTEAAPAGRLRHARRAAMVGMRSVTDHQVPFNRELVVAVDRLTRVVEELSTRLEVVDTIEQRAEETFARVQAGVATAAVQIDDLAGELAEVAGAVAGLAGQVAALEATAADQRHLLGATRAREDLVLRAARSGDGAAVVAAEADRADAMVLRRLGAAGRPRPEVLVAWARALAPVVAEAAAGAPVLDLDPDGGEWLDVWAELDVVGRGADSDEVRARALVERGHDVVAADPVAHLAEVPDGSVGAVSAATLADVRPLADLVAVVDQAIRVLRPGGALLLAAAHPGTLASADPLWADPRRRPLHPATLELLALERGFAEAQVVDLPDPIDPDAAPRAYALVARAAGGPATGS